MLGRPLKGRTKPMYSKLQAHVPVKNSTLTFRPYACPEKAHSPSTWGENWVTCGTLDSGCLLVGEGTPVPFCPQEADRSN